MKGCGNSRQQAQIQGIATADRWRAIAKAGKNASIGVQPESIDVADTGIAEAAAVRHAIVD